MRPTAETCIASPAAAAHSAAWSAYEHAHADKRFAAMLTVRETAPMPCLGAAPFLTRCAAGQNWIHSLTMARPSYHVCDDGWGLNLWTSFGATTTAPVGRCASTLNTRARVQPCTNW
jgi:hypothetical protein